MRRRDYVGGIIVGLAGLVVGCGSIDGVDGGSRYCGNNIEQIEEVYVERDEEWDGVFNGREIVGQLIKDGGYFEKQFKGIANGNDIDFIDIGDLLKGEGFYFNLGLDGIVEGEDKIKVILLSDGNLEFEYELSSGNCSMSKSVDVPYDIRNAAIGVVSSFDKKLEYSLNFGTREGSGLELPRRQNIFLDFDCDENATHNGESVNITASGFGEGTRRGIMEGLEEVFNEYDIYFFRSISDIDGEYSTVCFSGTSLETDGVLKSGFAPLDIWNGDRSDRAYVFESIRSDLEQMGFEEEIVNRVGVAAHEIGHLLGLTHVNTLGFIMYDSIELGNNISVGSFARSIVDSSVFYGNEIVVTQDSREMIGKLVGYSD